MVTVISLLLMFLAALTWSHSQAEKVMRPMLTTTDVWSDEEYIKHTVMMDINDPHLNVTVDVLKDLPEVDLHFEGSVVKKTDPTYFFAFNTTVNLCTVLHIKKQSPIGAVIALFLKEYGNFPEKCPIPAVFHDGRYGVRKFWLPESPASASLPEFIFNLHIHAHKLEPTSMERKLIAKDHFQGEGVIMDVKTIKMGFLNKLG